MYRIAIDMLGDNDLVALSVELGKCCILDMDTPISRKLNLFETAAIRHDCAMSPSLKSNDYVCNIQGRIVLTT
jgi:hypothetical protein